MEFTPLANDIKKIIYRYWHILRDIPGCETRPLIGLRRSKSIRNLITHTECKSEDVETSGLMCGHFKCHNCVICKFAWVTKHVSLPENDFELKLTKFSNCNTKNCIYLWICTCGKKYVGKSTRPIKIRIGEHRSRIRNRNLEAPLTAHYVEMGHSPEDFKFVVLEVVSAQPFEKIDIERVLLQKEAAFIHRLNTLAPEGLNNEMDLSCFI